MHPPHHPRRISITILGVIVKTRPRARPPRAMTRDDRAKRYSVVVSVAATVSAVAFAAVAVTNGGDAIGASVAHRPQRVASMLGGVDVAPTLLERRERGSAMTLGARLGVPQHPNSAAVRARKARRIAGRGRAAARRGRDAGGSAGWSTMVESAPAMELSVDSFKIEDERVDAIGSDLNRLESYGYDEEGEIVGDEWRRRLVSRPLAESFEEFRDDDEYGRFERHMDAALGQVDEYERFQRHLEAALGDEERVEASLGRKKSKKMGDDDDDEKSKKKDKKDYKRDRSDKGKKKKDEVSRLGTRGAQLTTPVYIMSLGDKATPNPDPIIGATDSDRVEHLVKELVREHGSKAVKKYVRLTPGVDVRDWPEKEDTVRFAFKSIMKQKPKATQLSALPWLSFYTSRDKDGQFNDKFAKERNLFTHIGCLFGHMFQWQLAADAGDDHAFMLESDAFAKTSIAFPFRDMGGLVKNAPKEYDIIFLDAPKDMTFDKPEKTFTDSNGDKMYVFRFKEKSTQSGLTASLVSKSFYPKIFKHLAHFGGDVVDSMLKVQLCTDSMVDSSGKFVGFGAGNKPWLKCYWALPAKDAKKKGNKFVYKSKY